MRTALILMAALLVIGPEARGQQETAVSAPAALLRLAETEQTREIAVHVSVDDLPYEAYWQKTFDTIFAFADSDQDGMLDDTEVRLVPSARAIRLSLGSGFTPPIAALQSMPELVGSESPKCSKAQLRNYYLRHGAGRVMIGCGKLTNSAAIADALLRALDEDRDGKLSEAELLKAEMVLQRLDTNDDELIGVGELVPSATYPGNWASNLLQPSASIDLSPAGDRSFVLSCLQIEAVQSVGSSPVAQHQPPAPGAPQNRTTWQIAINDQVRQVPLKVNTHARCESWSVPGPLNDLYSELRNDLTKAATVPNSDAADTGERDRRAPRDWLTDVADRNHDGTASPQEVEQWLALQQQLIHGQLLISVYHGGGLFELLDTNHDAGLSVRELRSAWKNLQAAAGTSAGHIDLSRLPNVLLFNVSQGYPSSLARKNISDVEWFRRMDRNSDDDVSRREFTGSPEAFSRLDKDRDGLISPSEAAEAR